MSAYPSAYSSETPKKPKYRVPSALESSPRCGLTSSTTTFIIEWKRAMMSDTELERSTMHQVRLHFVPLLFTCFVIAFLDRVNVGFAALTMNKDLGLSSTAYGLGVGLFFPTYFLFEVPSNLALQRFGARRWIARIMFTWGLLSGAMAFVQGEHGFYAVRL